MINQQVVIVNKLGLHARAAAKLVHLSSRFASEITLNKQGQQVSGKSIMGVMMLAASKGTEIALTADGEDEHAAIAAIVDLIESKFGETE